MNGLFSLRLAGLVTLAAALFFLLAFVTWGGFPVPAMAMAGFGLVMALSALALRRNWRWAGYFAFLLALAGSVTGYASAHDGSAFSNAWFTLAALVSLVAALLLFVTLWRAPRPA